MHLLDYSFGLLFFYGTLWSGEKINLLNNFLHYLFGENIKFTTMLSSEECKNRIRQSATEDSWGALLAGLFNDEQKILYQINGNGLHIRVKRSIRNGLQITFFGEFVSNNKKATFITGKYIMHRFGIVFLAFWELLVVSVAGFAVIGLLTGRFQPASSGPEFYFGMLIMLSMPLFGAGVFLFGKEIARRDKEIIEKFLENTCLAAKTQLK